MTNEQKKELVISVAQGIERLVENHLSNPAFNSFATDINVMAFMAEYTDLRDAGVTMGEAFNAIMNPETAEVQPKPSVEHPAHSVVGDPMVEDNEKEDDDA